ncbi:MAG: signal peptidase II [Mucilaginibacter sp.]
MNNRIKVLLFCLNCILFIGCDRVTKVIAKDHLIYGESISYLHDTFRLQYVENTGAALNLGDNLPKALSFWLLSIVPLGILVALFIYVITHLKKMNPLQVFSYSLIIAGGLGNIMDRILFDRHVTDFMNVGIYNLRTGIFNVADMGVTFGVIGLCIAYYKNRETLKPAEEHTNVEF